MADYVPTDWVDFATPVNAANLDKMEAGIDTAHQEIDALDGRLDTVEGKPSLPTVVDGQWVKGAGGVPVWSPIAQADVTGLVSALGAKESLSNKGIANGYAPLGADVKVPLANLPAISGGGSDLSYEGEHVPASAHQDGDIIIKDGMAFIAVRDTTQNPDPALWGAVGIPDPTPPPFETQGELAYNETPADVPLTATSEATAHIVGTASAVTLDGATPIIIEFYSSLVGAGPNAGNATALWLYDGATSLGRIGYVSTPAAANLYTPVRVSRRLTPSAGVHNYTIRASITGGTGGIVASGVGGTGVPVPAFIRISLAQPVLFSPPPGAVIPVTYGITLPTSPTDGQEAILVDNLTAPTYQWRFRRNAGASGAYKWEFIGGAPYAPAQAASVAIAASGWTAVGSAFVIPRTGEYLAAVNGYMSGGTVGSAAVAKAGDEAAKTVMQFWVGGGSGQPWLSGQSPFVYTAGDSVQLRVASSVALNLTRGAITLTPLRVA